VPGPLDEALSARGAATAEAAKKRAEAMTVLKATIVNVEGVGREVG